MRISALRSRLLYVVLAPSAAVAVVLPATTAPASAGVYVPISGSGSSWASIALDLWSQDVRAAGIVVNYNPDGSAAGRSDYISAQDDFAASDVPFRNGRDKLGGTPAEHSPWGYSYLPLVAGGIAFTYDLKVNGHQITNLRLSGKTLMEIFTGQITNWDSPQITHDYGTQLPNLPITPVIRSDGAGVSYYFTRWMAHVFPRQWNAFCDRVHPGITPPCGRTEFYPQFGRAQAENGAANVVTYIASGVRNGAIGYDEYAYVLGARLPALNLQNPAGDYVAPSSVPVTTALSQAVINTNRASPNFLQENLNRLYTYKNPSSYPLSYYGYMIVPWAGTKLPPNFTNGKGRTLSAFLDFALCAAGQAHVAQLGYAPLPANLVKGGLQQVKNIPGHGPVPSLSRCLG